MYTLHTLHSYPVLFWLITPPFWNLIFKEVIQPDFFLTCGGHLRQKGYQTISVMACSRKTCWRYASIATLEISDLVQLMYDPPETLMQMLLQLLDILHYCINLAISDYSSFIDVEHLISPINSFFTQYIFQQEVDICGYTSFQLKIPVTGCFPQHCFTSRKLHVFFSQFPKSTYRMLFPRHDPSVRQVTGGVLGLSLTELKISSRFLFGARCFTMYTNFKLVNVCVSLIH